jgi:hypothetical protein
MTNEGSIVVASGSRHWLPEVETRLRLKNPDARVLVAVFREPAGRIGFDLSEVGERLFGQIIGEAQSWSANEARGTRFLGGSPIEYVRTLFLRGLPTPITLAPAAIGAGPYRSELSHLEAIADLSQIDPDEEPERFSTGITALASKVDRLCVHSVAQWATTIVTVHGTEFLRALEKESAEAGAMFSHVPDERQLPQW